MRNVYIEFMRKQQSRKIRNLRDDLFEQLQRSTLRHKRLEIHTLPPKSISNCDY